MRVSLALLFMLISAHAVGANVPIEAAEVALISLVADQRDAKDMVYCISIEGKDAPAGTLAKLQRPDRIIVAGSKCRWSMDQGRGSYEIESKRPAYVVDVSRPSWKSSTLLTLAVSRSHNGKWAYGWTAELELIDGQWKVLAKTNEWAS